MSSSSRQSAALNGSPFRDVDRRSSRRRDFWRVGSTGAAAHCHSPAQYRRVAAFWHQDTAGPIFSGMPVPLLVAERPQGDIERPFRLHSEFQPAGDQPQAIDELCEGAGARRAGPGAARASPARARPSPWRMSSPRPQRPAIILAPNKTLAAQLYGEMKSFFPENAVEYFVSYYDYYQPEAYVPRTDTYIEKESLDQRADRPHAPFGDARDPRAPRRHHRRLGVVHLRHRLGRDLFGDDR